MSCDAGGHCITCGDVAVPMRVVEPPTHGLALCATETGAREVVEVSLVEPVAAGDEVLVHAGVAIA